MMVMGSVHASPLVAVPTLAARTPPLPANDALALEGIFELNIIMINFIPTGHTFLFLKSKFLRLA